MLLNIPGVVVNAKCVKAKGEDLGDDCKLYNSHWLLKTQIRFVSPKITATLR